MYESKTTTYAHKRHFEHFVDLFFRLHFVEYWHNFVKFPPKWPMAMPINSRYFQISFIEEGNFFLFNDCLGLLFFFYLMTVLALVIVTRFFCVLVTESREQKKTRLKLDKMRIETEKKRKITTKLGFRPINILFEWRVWNQQYKNTENETLCLKMLYIYVFLFYLKHWLSKYVDLNMRNVSKWHETT